MFAPELVWANNLDSNAVAAVLADPRNAITLAHRASLRKKLIETSAVADCLREINGREIKENRACHSEPTGSGPAFLRAAHFKNALPDLLSGVLDVLHGLADAGTSGFVSASSLLHVFLDLADELFPGALDRARAEARSCRRPMTPQSTPLFGTGRYSNLWFNVGLGHMGWTMASGGARITADLIAGRPTGVPLDGLQITPA